MAKYKDITSDALSRLFNPARLQVSLAHMLKHPTFTGHFKQRRAVTAVTVTSRPYRGELQLTSEGYLFRCAQGVTLLRNAQLILLVFSIDGTEYFSQAEPKTVFPEHLILAPLQARFHRRFDLRASASLWPVLSDDVAAFLRGDRFVRRSERDGEGTVRANHFINEHIMLTDHPSYSSPLSTSTHRSAALLKQPDDSPLAPHPATLLDLSQGGCSLLVPDPDGAAAKRLQMVLMQTTLAFAGKSFSLSCFAIVKATQSKAQGMILRCAFTDPLAIPDGELSAIGSYSLAATRGREAS